MTYFFAVLDPQDPDRILTGSDDLDVAEALARGRGSDRIAVLRDNGIDDLVPIDSLSYKKGRWISAALEGVKHGIL